MIALYNDPDATEIFEQLGEVKKGEVRTLPVYLCYRGMGFARNIIIESGSPDISISCGIPVEMRDGEVVALTIEWHPSDVPTGNGILITAEEVVEVRYGS